MEPQTSILKPASHTDIHQDLENLLTAARANFANRDIRKTADALCAAHAVAEQHRLFSEAAQLRKAITILATGGRPKLLTHVQALFSERAKS